MSVKLFYDTTISIDAGQAVGGFCYCRRPGPPVKPLPNKPYIDHGVYIDICPPENLGKREPSIATPIDFGMIPVETTVFRDVVVHASAGTSPTELILEKVAEDPAARSFDRAFRLVFPVKSMFPEIGAGDSRSIGRRRKLKFRLYFEPELPGMNYMDTFRLWAGDVLVILNCSGICDGPSVCFSENLINFGGHFYRDEGRAQVTMHNESACEAKFQFDTDNLRSPFKVCPTCGVIPAFTSLVVELLFHPTKPQTYYKRVICLIHHQQPQYLDLVGICIPRPFFVTIPIDFGLSTAHTEFLPLPTESNEEYFQSHCFWGIKLSSDIADFGKRDIVIKGELPLDPFELSVTSVLPYDVVVEWGTDTTNVFEVLPQSIVLQAFRSADFFVTFTPSFPDTFYDGQLECYIRPTGYVWPPQYGPPWIYSHKEELFDSDFNKSQSSLQKLAIDRPTSSEPAINSVSAPEVPVTEPNPAPEKPVGIPRPMDATPGVAVDGVNDVGVSEYFVPAVVDQELKRRLTLVPPLKPVKKPPGKGNKKKAGGKKREELTPPEVIREHKEKPVAEAISDKGEALNEPKQQKSVLFTPEVGQELEAEAQSLSEFHKDLPKRPRRRSTFIEPPFSLPLLMTVETADGEQKEPLTLSPVTHIVDPLGNPVKGFLDSLFISPSHHRMSLVPGSGRQKTDEEEVGMEPVVQPCGPETGRGVPEELALPLCLSLRVTGHTYQRSPLVTHFKSPKTVTMSPTWPLSQVCRSVILRNNNDLPVYFDAAILDPDETFKMKPTKGLIPGNFHQIVMVTMSPIQPNTALYSQNCEVSLNLQDKNTMMLRGIAEIPTLILCCGAGVTGSEIIFPETVPGRSSHTFMKLTNPTRFHFRYELCPERLKQTTIFSATPTNGIIQPYQSIQIDFKFAPMHYFDYYCKWKAVFFLMKTRNETRNVATSYELELPIIGVARQALVEADPRYLDFGLVQISSPKALSITVRNTGQASITANIRASHEEWLQSFPKDQITISPTLLSLEGAASAEVTITVQPDRMKLQRFYIEYEVEVAEAYKGLQDDQAAYEKERDLAYRYLKRKSLMQSLEEKEQKFVDRVERKLAYDLEHPEEAEKHKKKEGFLPICTVSFLGDHPVLGVTDIAMIARHPVWDSSQSWSMFSLDSINYYLKPQNHNFDPLARVPKVPTVNFRFPPAPLNSEPALFTLVLTNPGLNLAADWNLQARPPKKWTDSLFSTRQEPPKLSAVEELQSEIWKQRFIGLVQGEDNRAPASLEDVMNTVILHTCDTAAFYVTPQSGILEPGQETEVSFRYCYVCPGTHRTSILLQVHPGLRVWLELTGVTLPLKAPYVQHMHFEEMSLHPVSLSDMDPPIQLFWMFNGGEAGAKFEVWKKPFAECLVGNYGHEVFECLDYAGVIGPRAWFPIRLRFSPIEIKDYTLSLRVTVDRQVAFEVMLKGIPAMTQKLLVTPEMTGFHPGQRYNIVNPLVPVTISPPRVTFKHFIPTGQQATNIVFLTNLSNSNKLSYTWPVVPVEGGGSITFKPDNGVLEPGEEATCMIVVKGGLCATMFSRMLRVTFVDETAFGKWEFAIKYWNSCKELLMQGGNNEEEAMGELTKKFGPAPDRPPSFSRLLTVTAYITTSYSCLDLMDSKERARLQAPPRCKPLPPKSVADPENKARLTLPPFAQQLSREVVSSVLWDIMNSASMHKFIRDGPGIEAPLFYEYKASEEAFEKLLTERKRTMSTNHKVATVDEDELSPELPVHGSQEILENVVFNMMQELTSSFQPGQIPPALSRVQPQEIVDVNNYRNAFI